MFQRCKRDLNISFMGVVRGSRDRQNELFANVDRVLNDNVKILERQVSFETLVAEILLFLLQIQITAQDVDYT